MIRGLFAGAVVCCFLLFLGNADAALIHGKDYQNPNGDQVVRVNSSGQITQTLQAGEDQTNSTRKVEQQFSYKLTTADAQAKDSPGFVHTVTCATAAGSAATAGTVSIHDALTETTPTIATIGIPATAFVPFTVTLDAVATTGIYVGYATAAGISCTVSYR
jgi:hypothetical protein